MEKHDILFEPDLVGYTALNYIFLSVTGHLDLKHLFSSQINGLPSIKFELASD